MAKMAITKARLEDILRTKAKFEPRIEATIRLRIGIAKFVREVFAPASQVLGHDDAKWLLESLLNDAVNGCKAWSENKVKIDG